MPSRATTGVGEQRATSNEQRATSNEQRASQFEALVTIVHQASARFAPSWLREDLAQHILCKCWHAHLHAKLQIQNLAAYACSAVRRELACFRQQQRPPWLSLDEALVDQPTREPAAAATDVDAFRRALRARLSERLRDVYELRHERNYSVREAARRLHLDPHQVRRHIAQIEGVAMKMVTRDRTAG